MPSASLTETGVQVRVSSTPAGSGVMVAPPITGGVLDTTRLSLTSLPVSVPSYGVTSQVTVSPPTKPLDRLVDDDMATPPTDHSTSEASLSPSGSENPDQEQVRVSPTTASLGRMVAEAALGGALETTSELEAGVPVSVPSLGVTVQVTRSPRTSDVDRVVAVPTAEPSSSQTTVDASASPSGSDQVQEQVRASPAIAGSGSIATSETEGAALSITRLSLTGVPVSVPSSGVTSQPTRSPAT